MSSRREQILAALASRLTGTVEVGSRIYRSRVEALARAEAPAIVVAPGPDRAVNPEITGGVSMCKLDNRLSVAIAVYVRGAIPDQEADAICVDVHAKIMAGDRTLGGLCMAIIPQGWDPQMDAADQNAGWMVMEYVVRYRTAITAIDAG